MEYSTWTEITVNGKTYSSIEEMPPDVRAQFEQMQSMLVDKDHNGIPDIAEDGTNRATVVQQVTTSTKTLPMGGSMPGNMSGPSSVRTLGSTANRGSSGGVQMSRAALSVLLIGMALVAAGVTWILSR
jgi:hypothetical protein